MKSLRTLLVELKQLPAEIGYILGWVGTILAALIFIASAFLFLALSNEPAFALGGVRPCGLRNRLGSVLHPYGASIIRQTESAHAKLRDCAN